MFRLEIETMDVCQRNVARFVHVECRFDKIEDIFQGFENLESLRLQKDGGTKGKEIWTNLSHRNTGDPSSRCKELLFVNPNASVQLVKRDIVTAVIFYYITTEFITKRDSRLSAYRPLQKRERTGKEYGCFPFVWKTKTFKRKIDEIWESLPRLKVFRGGKWQNGSS